MSSLIHHNPTTHSPTHFLFTSSFFFSVLPFHLAISPLHHTPLSSIISSFFLDVAFFFSQYNINIYLIPFLSPFCLFNVNFFFYHHFIPYYRGLSFATILIRAYKFRKRWYTSKLHWHTCKLIQIIQN